ncbi:MAG: nucleoside hydrolase [Anaerolineae bacterium]|jgi:inosine-uridine nucleoside N-ribohydrolase
MVNVSQVAPIEPQPVIIDTDLSFDDYVALIFLLQHPDVDVRAITVVNGVVHVKPGTENVRRLLSLTGHTTIPFAGGPEKPLRGQHAFPADWRFLLDYALRLLLPMRSLAVPSKVSAAELICQQVSASETPVTFVALGPLTNLALALRADPTLATRFDRVLISGGAIHTAGTIRDVVPSHPNTVAEWNLYIDPAAADIVFNSGTRLELVPLDVTHTSGAHPLLFRREFVRHLAALARERATKTIVRIVRVWQLLSPRCQSIPMWDAIVAAIAVDATIGCDWRDMAIRVVQEPEDVAGQTIVDDNGQPNVCVCLAGDQEAFEEAYLAAIC